MKTFGTEPVLQVLGLRLYLPKQSARRAKFARNNERREGGVAHGAFLSGADFDVVCFWLRVFLAALLKAGLFVMSVAGFKFTEDFADRASTSLSWDFSAACSCCK